MIQARIQVGFIQHEPGRPHLGRAAYVFIYTGRIARESLAVRHMQLGWCMYILPVHTYTHVVDSAAAPGRHISFTSPSMYISMYVRYIHSSIV